MSITVTKRPENQVEICIDEETLTEVKKSMFDILKNISVENLSNERLYFYLELLEQL